ncbi:nucleotidyl transferase AbiEii/AbiGii toxin family protein [Bifidobacterium myosotis]|uniref:Nucleotidyl transferase AbiEii/AbiGii toxin family protein n=1 Tax=Bifidobacterium myosotis TaxID=1630166 RepID=A0A5M9ZHR0_9BIFI|nr:nucleotidyl transferase AbiEii/AbiGii toxin family protein [Bifidobacterium myosotis]KAA8826985.1 hypothetical protein EMO91_10670 [Bifidobacterium myosotis]
MNWFDSDGRPPSAKKLYKLMQQASREMDPHTRDLYMQAVHNAVLSQFLGDGDFLKGGAAIQLSYPLREGRLSEDIDTVYADSKTEFEAGMVDRLRAGWQGFTGTIESLPHGKRTLMPEGASMSRYKVKLLYKNKPFSSFYIEAVPDLNGVNDRTESKLDPQYVSLLNDLGLKLSPVRMMDKTTQIAEKLHALNRKDKIRANDLADIAEIMKHERVDYDGLRESARRVEHAQRQHPIKALPEELKDDFRAPYAETGSSVPFDEAWNTVRGLLHQVDPAFKKEWRTSAEQRYDEEIDRIDRQGGRHGPQTRDSRGRYSHNAW